MSDTIPRSKNTVNNQHALIWAVIGWLSKPGTFVYWSTHCHAECWQAQTLVVEALMSTNLDIKRVLRANGNEEIRLENGSRVQFRARTSQSGRGVSADKLILDEAYHLTDAQLATLLSVALYRGSEIVYAQTEFPRGGDHRVYHNNTDCPGHETSQFKGGIVCPRK